MSIYNYQKYKILISPESKKTQGLKAGDIARRQYFDNPNLIYSLMIVVETGVDAIGDKDSHYFIGALIEGDAPKNGEILDFVRVTNLFDLDRSGALYLTASDSEAPFMDIIDGMAYENSLCFPVMCGGSPDMPDKNKYCIRGKEYIEETYVSSTQGAGRILKLTRNNQSLSSGTLGLNQPIAGKVEHPQRVIVSYQIRASKEKTDIPVTFGYLSGEEAEGSDTITITKDWTYKLHLINIDYPAQYQRSFDINLSGVLTHEKDWCEIADLNIVLQADIATFAGATKARIGKVKGIIDPVFGILEGYGAYFQNMYATKNVNIAGTLTAGDENGFSSTFYVGKIHKNVILNSIEPTITGNHSIPDNERTPVGIGQVILAGNDIRIKAQSAEWRGNRQDSIYCFSFWAKCNPDSRLSLYQDEYHIGDISELSYEWKRVYVSFIIHPSEQPDLTLRIRCNTPNFLLTAPQLEAGQTPSQYQPTDDTLSFTEDYGAWFNKGGIGGTIQNPLLRLNEDGSICSRDSSFVINPDGTGHFASGRFKWTKNTIVLQDVTIRWEDFDEEFQEHVLPRSVSLSGTGNIFHYSDELDISSCKPAEINIFATEHNFNSTARKWQYLCSDSIWKDIPGSTQDFIKVAPDSHFWEERKTLSFRYVCKFKEEEFSEIFTLNKLSDGQSSYSVHIHSSNGNVFRNHIVSTVLTAYVFKGPEDVTHQIPAHNFRWKRISRDTEGDLEWNSVERHGNILEITGDDIWCKAVFDCEVNLTTI